MVEIAPFGVEAWLNKWEKSARYDISQSTIASLTMDELMSLDGHHGAEFYEMLNAQKMNYGWIEGSPALRPKLPSSIATWIRTTSCRPMARREQISWRSIVWWNPATT